MQHCTLSGIGEQRINEGWGGDIYSVCHLSFEEVLERKIWTGWSERIKLDKIGDPFSNLLRLINMALPTYAGIENVFFREGDGEMELVVNCNHFKSEIDFIRYIAKLQLEHDEDFTLMFLNREDDELTED